MAPDPVRAQRLQAERYRLVERIGQGGMATVWRAEDEKLGREVAVKVLLPFLAEQRAASERFAREARALAGIRHPNVLQLFDFREAVGDEPAHLIMELLRGPSLQRFVVDLGTPLPEVAALIGAEVAAGLAAVHARGIVHRDVKPENVLLDAGRIVLTDFGIARVELDADRTALTQTGAIIGSPAYMSPEQARGEDVGAASDQFSLGSLIYFLATGTAPFSGPHPLVVMQKIDRGEYVACGAKNPRVPAWLDRIVRRCLMRDPAARFPDVGALATALRRGLADDGFDDPAAELRRYFADPPAFNAALAVRIAPRRFQDAEAALARGDRTRALASIERVLQLEPSHEQARALFERLSQRSRRGVHFSVGAVLAACALAAPFAWARWYARPPAVVAPAALVAPAAAVQVVAPRPDPAPPPVATAPRDAPASVKVARTRAPRAAAGGPTGAAPAPAVVPEATAAPVAPAPTTGELSIHTAPWCDLTVDGRPIGRTPQTLALPGGAHAVSCRNPSGASFARTIEIVTGERKVVEERLVATAELRPSLARGDALAVDGGAASAASRPVAIGRHRVTLEKDGHAIDARWLDVPAGGCKVSDTPELHCEAP